MCEVTPAMATWWMCKVTPAMATFPPATATYLLMGRRGMERLDHRRIRPDQVQEPGSRFGVYYVGFMVWILRFRVSGLEFRA